MVPTSLVALGLAVGLIAPPPVTDLTLTDMTGSGGVPRPRPGLDVAGFDHRP